MIKKILATVFAIGLFSLFAVVSVTYAGVNTTTVASCQGKAVAGECIPADVNGDGVINADDISALSDTLVPLDAFHLVASCIGQDVVGKCATADTNGDGIIDSQDLSGVPGTQPANAPLTNLVMDCFGKPVVDACAGADPNGDGKINTSDMLIAMGFGGADAYSSPSLVVHVSSCIDQPVEKDCANADINHDGTIDTADVIAASGAKAAVNTSTSAFLLVYSCIGKDVAGECAAADTNGDGIIDNSDANASDVVALGLAAATSSASCVDLTHTMQRVPASTDVNSGGEVSILQEFLARDTSIYPEGLITGFFGALTEKAVQRWQIARDVVPADNPGTPATTGYGVVGPDTRSSIRIASGCAINPGVVVAPTVTVTSPNGGEIYELGDTVKIKWSTDYVGTSKYEIGLIGAGNDGPDGIEGTADDVNGGYEVIANVNHDPAGYAWVIPLDTATHDDYKIVVSIGERGLFLEQDESDNTFAIVKPSKLTVMKPNGGEQVGWGVNYTINWVNVGFDHWYTDWFAVSKVRIRLLNTATGVHTILTNATPNDGVFAFNPASYGLPVGSYKVVINATTSWLFSGRFLEDKSDNAFSVVKLTVTAPNGGESWAHGTPKAFTWATLNYAPGRVHVWLQNVDTGVWKLIGNNVLDTGIYNWTVSTTTAPAGASWKALIQDTGGTSRDYSDATFTITD
ncbi:MAG: hypothetical protein COZ49_03175 [Candidatus Yonathbacteria bacterium CG_4_10_14_3_um_filter_47_65]|uniref:Dockerin domain-containing protein n=2 Tax=Parcubacteria group TaxID=1794811 RepID=A0A2M8D8F6_9BACT|nr:MAG: hypothetical protein AUJ44_00730 [Candidatus Nomurabacteria bacterium CG1_02_47_685]PIP03150.1 MAG: hypothetical protein COX54_04650 [Candidatus Yonathbacteria bacterium CG23_combo_of_CG06-09_8_20_14_all_46_18]PIQ32098.1 MAG: hypothetical protein COW61_02440 [Candidatus Yonathbacteria bacterium CG17_big_fil_post_rev_8_21_14_2_50_46_19]PIX56228.1 MAG: hypothetical protein COZ49_03175 [Candidatus Yonathbacteria bacterium CG_4_10_14_3_um_filter_47_65]PIY57355.1 MAG: hypothetical protein CO